MSTTAHSAIKSLIEQIDGATATFFTSCVHCGMCADACLFFTESQDPRYTPIHKLAPMRKVWQQEFTFWGRLMKAVGITKPITEEELADWEELVYDTCTMCGRCSLVCPVGNDITYMIRKFREAMVASGHAPQGLKDAMTRAIELGGPMGVTLKTLQAQIKHAEKELGFEIPMDIEGAEYMMLLSSAEIAQFHEIIPAVARIFKKAGVSWTFCSEAFEGTNTGVQIGAADLAAELVERIVKGAEKLKVKTVISPECGHAYMALRWEGPNLIGRPYNFKVLHILEVLDDLRKQGKLKTTGKDNTRMTYHDPCQIARRGGIVEQPRNLINEFADNFVEMDEHGEFGWCCGGGGGVSANERAEERRLDVFSRKKQQLDDIKVDRIVTACSNCRNMLEEGLEHYHMENIEVVGLTETLANYLDESQ
ncbi:MAG: (Fe-S)-binding protein [Gammaproteobacteria bacterium]|jgi:Fe-S oxidoreductase